ncbi:Nicotinamide-nucleotide amidase [hydrothermal vent metagenome]|uniref:Nicotinamide-nucleotide amidase n=1 Tax=hydrothermal vent metagenome TaxID=652676 RepID=A0A3B0X563_9ZZZZ
MNEADIFDFARELTPRLILQSRLLATAESCTGGWVAKSLTDIDGSSQWFDCSIVSYSNTSKQALLGVDSIVLDQYGAVSQAVVEQMVLGLLDRCDANLGISISGIAGPGGGADAKPVGTVWIAWATPGTLIESICFQFGGNRRAVRLQAVFEALKGVERFLVSDANC